MAVLKRRKKLSVSSTLEMAQDDEQPIRRTTLTPALMANNQEAVKKHFEFCHKMFLKNKITPENSWSFHIIDHLTSLVNAPRAEKHSLQSAATALEICTKIYGCRVDYLHARGVKLAQALDAQSSNPDEEELDDTNLGSGDAQKNKKKKKINAQVRLKMKRRISKNISSLLGTVPQLPEVPFIIESDGDHGQTRNLFTFTVPFDQYYQEHLRNNKTPGFLSTNDVDQVNEQVIKAMVPKIENFNICKEFEDYEVNAITVNLNTTTEHNFDADGQPIVELDGSTNDIFTNQENGAPIVEGDSPGVCKETQILSFSPSRAGPSNLKTSEEMREWNNMIWIGPNHWKHKMLRRSMSRYSGTIERVQKNPRKRVCDDKTINFFVDLPKIDFNKKAKRVVHKAINETKYLLPRNYLKREPLDDKCMLFNYAPPEEEQDETIPISLLQNISSVQVLYAMHAKKINMRRIRSAMINILKEKGILSTANSPEEIKFQMFHELYDQLNRELPQTVRQEMNIPIAFLALLHLTNEMSLSLEQTKDLNNVKITSEVPVPPHLREK